jgi:hypothetical protein
LTSLVGNPVLGRGTGPGGQIAGRWRHQAVFSTYQRQGFIAEISGVPLWRWLSQDAIRPWRHRSWTFPRDPQFLHRASPILDLYQELWSGTPLTKEDFVICPDEKSSVQVRQRKHSTLPVGPGRPSHVEHEYKRGGALIYIAAWDVPNAKLFGRC